MQHFYDYINSSDFNNDELSKANVSVTLKIDGTSLQILNDGKLTFHKRGKDDITPGPELTQIDAFTDYEYYNAMKHLVPTLKKIKEQFQGVKLLNLEIVENKSQHFVQYKTTPKNNLCLLNAVSVNDKTIKQSMVKKYAEMLNVELVPEIFNGVLPNFKGLIDYVKQHCDYHNPKDTGNFKDEILNLLGVPNFNSSLLNTEDNQIEGFVFNFNLSDKHILLKIDSPAFMTYVASNNDDKNDEQLEPVINDILNRVKNASFKKCSNDRFTNLIQNFINISKADKGFIKFMFDCSEKSRPTLDGLLNATALDKSLLPKQFTKYATTKEFFYGLRMFIWVFGKIKTGRNHPIMTKFNPYIESMGLK